MANQAIALQARAPQNDFMGRAIQQNAQMMNMMAQQRAAERQAAVAQQEMQLARAAEERAAAKEGRDIERFAVDQDALLYAKYRNMAPSVIASNSPEVYAQWLGMLNEESPERAQMIARAMPPEQFNKDTFTLMMGTMDQNFEARYGKAITKELITPEGGVLGANISGIPGATYAVPVPDISRPRAGTPAQNPMPAFPTPAAPATDAQIDEAARKILRGAGIAELGIGADDFDRATERANRMTAGGGGRMQPISMTTGAQMGGQPDMTAVVQDMMSSGQISQSNLQLMREMAGPDKDAQLAQILKANNIQIVPDEQPGMRSAVFRPGQDVAPQMQQAQFNPNDYEPVRVKSPMQSPSQDPRTAGAVAEAQREPIPQAARRAEAQREPIPEAGARAAETERASKQAQADVEFLEKYRSDRRTAQEALMLINRMIGDTNLTDGRLIYKKGGKGPHAGFEDVVGATWRPGYRLVPGTEAADFDRMLEQIKGSAFLTAYERLKGGGPIASVEGEKGTTAITRLDRNLSEKEFVVAARELEASIRDAIRRADERYARVKGQKPAAQAGATKRLRFNPATGGFE